MRVYYGELLILRRPSRTSVHGKILFQTHKTIAKYKKNARPRLIDKLFVRANITFDASKNSLDYAPSVFLIFLVSNCLSIFLLRPPFFRLGFQFWRRTLHDIFMIPLTFLLTKTEPHFSVIFSSSTSLISTTLGKACTVGSLHNQLSCLVLNCQSRETTKRRPASNEYNKPIALSVLSFSVKVGVALSMVR